MIAHLSRFGLVILETERYIQETFVRMRYLIISDFGMVHQIRLTLLQFSQTTTLAKDPPKSTLTNGTSLLSSATSSKAGT
jgi:hypothetical protein